MKIKFAAASPFFGLAFTVLASGPVEADDDAILIEPTWKVGKQYTCEHNQDVVITLGQGDQALENPVKFSVTFEVEVSANGKKGEKALAFRATKTKMSMNLFGQEFEYDSEDKEKQSPDVSAMLEGIVNTGDLKVIFDKDDKFLRFEGGEKSAEAGTAPGVPTIRFGNNEIRQILAYCVRSFPDHPVKKGDKWSTEETVNLNLGSVDVKMNMTAKGANDKGRPLVDYESKIDVRFPEGGLAAGGQGKGKMEGEMTYDPEKAVIVEHVTATKMTVDMSGLPVPVKQSAKTTVVKVEDVEK